MEGKASDCSPEESWTRFCATCGPVASRPITVTSPPTEHRASANITAGRRRNFRDAIKSPCSRLSQDAVAVLPDGTAPRGKTRADLRTDGTPHHHNGDA